MHYLKRFFCVMTAVIMLSGIVHATKTEDKNGSEEYVIFSDKNSIITEDMRKKSQVTEEDFKIYLQRFPNLSGIEAALVEAQDLYNVNAILMLAIIRLESGNGGSALARNQNNLGGITAPRNSVTVYRSFDSKDECVFFMARLLGEQYLYENGRFFNGYTLTDIAVRYSVSSNWSTLVRDIMFEIQHNLLRLKV